MRRWMIAAAAAALLSGAWWQWPAAAQRTPEPTAAEEMITFDQYREFRMRDLQQRQARLAHRLAAPGLSAAEKASLERRKAYYDRLAAMPAEELGQLDPQERAAWREKQREYYRQQAAERAGAASQRQ